MSNEPLDPFRETPASPRPTARPSILATIGLPFVVRAAVKRGDKVGAIRLLREQGRLGLEEAKQTAERIEREVRDDLPSVADGRSPGEVPRRGGAFWAVVALVVVAIVLIARDWLVSPG